MKIRSLGQMLLGIMIVALGLGFLLNALGLADFGQLISTWWPSLVIIAGLLGVFSNPRQFWWPLLIVAFGVLWQLDRLDLIHFNVWQVVWPSAIIIFGLSLLFGSGPRKKFENVNEDKVELFVAFSGQNARNVSSQFEGGKATALFGGIELDLTEAKIKDGTADLDVFTCCGGIDIRVPEGWVVKVTGLPIMGGWEDKTHLPKNTSNAPVLNIHGTCIMGGVSIKHGKPTQD